MLSNLSNNNSGNATKSVVEKKHYEEIEDRLNELQDEIDSNTESINQNAQDISGLDDRVEAVENNSTFPELNTDTINPATGDKVEITSGLEVDGEVEASSVKTGELSVNGTNFTTVANNASQAKTTAESAKDRADEAYGLADALSDELADYKADNEQSITTGTLNADSVVTDSISAQTINTNDFETTNAAVDKLYVDTIKATGFLELPTAGQSYYTITIPAKTTASFSGVYTSDNNTDFPFYFTVSDGAVIYKQNSTEIIKDISFNRETGNTKVRVKSSTNLTYISSALDSNPVTIEDGGDAYTDYVFIPQKTGGYLIRGYDDTTTEVYIAGVLKAYAMSVEEEIIERTSVDFLKVNNSIELPEDWDIGGTISYSTGEENQYISAQTKAGVTKPTWTSPIHSTIGSLSYSSKLVDEATVASYKGISETRQTETISITNEASLQQLTAFHWTKNGNYWQPYELTRITIGDNTMWIDPTEANQGIRFIDNQVIADGTWNDVPVEEANAVPVNLVIFDAPTELSFPITNLGDKTTVHGEITATCFKGNVLGNVTGNADTATNATCFNSKTYAEAKADILSGCAADSNMFNGKTYSEACADILSGNAATATNATCFDGKTYSEAKADILSGCASAADNATCFDGHTYADAKADILSGNAASATNATCFNGKTYAEAKTDILSGCAANADNATCFNGCTYACAKADILSGTAAQANCVDIDSLTTNSYPLVMESTTCELGKSGTCPITFTPSSGILETTQVTTSCIENSGTTKSQCLCATCDINVDGNAYITGDLTVQGTITTTHSEEVVTPSENIILRDGATTPIASGCYSGFTVTNYDGQDNNLEIGADKDGTLHVGVVGETMEPIATRAAEACMENGYAAHWDSTGTDLVTKGDTNTHNLTVNGDASVTGNLSVTGTLTADLTGTADNATCFDNKTYAEACADILSGCASEADNATCFGGCTYACAKADILSGCAADSAKLGNKDPSCYIDTSATAQTKAGHLCIGAPSACTSTSAGGNGNILGSTGIDIYGSTSLPHIHFHNNKYCGEYSARIANTTGRVALTVNNGTGCTEATESKIFDFCSDGTFKGATNICGTNIYQNGNKVIDTSSTAQTKAGHLRIGAPDACTSTCAGGQGTFISSVGVIDLYRDSCPYVDFHYQKYCGDFSSRIANMYATNSCNGILRMTVNNGKGCTASDTTTNFDFYSDGTFTGATNICASCNIYSAGCPVVTTGTLPTVAPGYNCTGTSNYVVTTMVCCAKAICRYQTTTAGTCHLALFSGNTALSDASMYVSSACPLTYNPATGVLTTCSYNGLSCNYVRVRTETSCLDKYFLLFCKTGESTIFCEPIHLTGTLGSYAGSSKSIFDITIDFRGSTPVARGFIFGDKTTKTTLGNIIPTLDSTTCTYRVYWKSGSSSYTGIWYCHNYSSDFICSPTPEDSMTGTSYPDLIYELSTVDRASSAMSVCNVPTSASTTCNVTITAGCCSASAPTNYAWRFCGCNGSMYNPGNIYVGSDGGRYAGGSVELYAPSPFIDFHHNCYCGDYSSRIINGSQGLTQLIVNNGTGTTAATESTTYCFASNGTFSGACTVIAACTCTMCVNGYNAATNNYANLKFQATCCDATTRCNWNMCLCGCNGILYNPQGFGGNLCGSADNSTCFGGCTYAQAKADIAGSVETTPYTCINDVNTGAQDILMTSSTGTLGIVNASTGTNARPLKYNPATGELSSKCVATNIVKLGEHNYIFSGVDTGETWNGEMQISNYDGFTICAKHPTCSASSHNWPYAVACSKQTSLGVRARASQDSVAVGYCACSANSEAVAVGEYANAMGSGATAVGAGACAADNYAVAIGVAAQACCGGLAIGCQANTCCCSQAYLQIFKDIRFGGFRETTFCIADCATQNNVYYALNGMFCSNPAEGCPGYGHSEWPAYGIRGCHDCFYGGICSGTWGGTGCPVWFLGGLNFTKGCTATVGCNMFVTVIAPLKA